MTNKTLFYATPASREAKIKAAGLPAHLAANARHSFVSTSRKAAYAAAARVAQAHDVDMQVWSVKCPTDAIAHVQGKVAGLTAPAGAGSVKLLDTLTSLDADEYAAA
jgi:hypothetical protein